MLNGIFKKKNFRAHVILNNNRLKTVSPKSTTRVNVYFKYFIQYSTTKNRTIRQQKEINILNLRKEGESIQIAQSFI